MRWLVSLIINCLLSGTCCSIKNCMCCSWAIFSWQLLWFSRVSEKNLWEQCANWTPKSPKIVHKIFAKFRALYSTYKSATCSQTFPALCDSCKWLVRLIKRVWCNFPALGIHLFWVFFFRFSRLSCYFISKLRWPFSPPVQDKLNRASNRGRNDLRSVLLSTPFMNGKNGSKRGGFMKRWLCNTSAITADTSCGDILSGSSGECGSGIKRFERESDSASCL